MYNIQKLENIYIILSIKDPKESTEKLSEKFIKRTAGPDGGRYTSPPHTTKRSTRKNVKTKNNQNCQKIELYGSLTTKELKKKHLTDGQEGQRWAAGAERTHSEAAASGPGDPKCAYR